MAETNATNHNPVVHIVPVENGTRVDYGNVTGRVFQHVWDINVVNGKPLYIAQLPSDETDALNNSVLVYGTDKYGGPEDVVHVLGFIGDEPAFVGVWVDGDEESWCAVIGHKVTPFDDEQSAIDSISRLRPTSANY